MPLAAVAAGIEVNLEFHRGGEGGSSLIRLSEMSDEDLAALVRLLKAYGHDLVVYVEARVPSTTPPSNEFVAAAGIAGVTVYDKTHPNTKHILLQKCVQSGSDIEEIPMSMISIGMLAKVLNEQVS